MYKLFARCLIMITGIFCSTDLRAQDGAATLPGFRFEPSELRLSVGDSAKVRISLLQPDGRLLRERFVLYVTGLQARTSVELSRRNSDTTGVTTAVVRAHRPGTFKLAARRAGAEEGEQASLMPVDIPQPPLAAIAFVDPPGKLYAGSSALLRTRVTDAAGLERKDLRVELSSGNEAVARFDMHGRLTATGEGDVKIVASAEDVRQAHTIRVLPNPVARLSLKSDRDEARTGDVLHFDVVASDGLGKPVPDVRVQFGLQAHPDDRAGAPSSGQIIDDGRFVADTPGLYVITASIGDRIATKSVRILPRNVQKAIEVVGHGAVLDVLTSDIWVWEGVDGRDYAVTGTWGAKGDAYFWDITDPTAPAPIDTVSVDARTVNDVKVSADGRIAVITREGASNRRNGIVILDVTAPADVKILAEYTDELTGGVHNVFIYDQHVYAVNNGRRFDVINIADPQNPVRVGRFELDTPGHAIHDVWIEDGIAYSSNWQDGVQLVDIGGATSGPPFREFGAEANAEVRNLLARGGSPEAPLKFASYTYPSGWNHAAFPFRSESANKFYVLAGDEAYPYGDNTAARKPTITAGWIHFVDFTNLAAPEEVARFEVPLAGSHNFWVENEILYAAFYNGGLRVVDVSGELMGDLYRQGREIAWFMPSHLEAHVPNVPMVWGPMPYKGLIYLSDHHTGLWAVRLVDKEQQGNR